MNQGRFSRFEQQIEQLVEGSFARLFAGRLQPREVATHLARAMEDNAHVEPDSAMTAPNLYTIYLNPEDHRALMKAQPNLAESLANTVVALANRGEMRLISHPKVYILADAAIPLRAVQVLAEHEITGSRATQLLDQASSVPQVNHQPQNPQLIVAGHQYMPLDRPVLNIGRRHDNHIVIDDMRVSRLHAQLRLRFGHYVLYDLGSSGGTFVNEHAVTECILNPGDVISLAGVSLVYIEDEGSTNQSWSQTDTALKRPGETSSASPDSPIDSYTPDHDAAP
jgi:Protein of unknown function (DUF3662)/FHA domain